jgi:hypothetical protein
MMTNQDLAAEVRSDHINVNGECNVCSAGRWAFKWPCESVRLADEVERLTKLIEAKDEYIELLKAVPNGWMTDRFEAGEKARAKIAALTHD